MLTFFVTLQNITMRRYNAPLSLTSLVCFMGTLQSIAVTLVMEHKASVWNIGWDMNLLAAAYAIRSLNHFLKIFKSKGRMNWGTLDGAIEN